MTALRGVHELHPALREAWDFVEEVRRELLQVIQPVSVAQWNFCPAGGGWCIAQLVDHLLHAEIGTSKMVRKLIRGDYRAQAVTVGEILHTRGVDRYPYGRLAAPPGLVPGPIRDRPEVERELGLAHARLRSELSVFHGDDPEALRSPDPATGDWFTLVGWVKLQAWHEAHHTTQILTIMASSHFPR
ncbi:MAG: DinB family protein [Candidatus Methylomirabilales bacterium]